MDLGKERHSIGHRIFSHFERNTQHWRTKVTLMSHLPRNYWCLAPRSSLLANLALPRRTPRVDTSESHDPALLSSLPRFHEYIRYK